MMLKAALLAALAVTAAATPTIRRGSSLPQGEADFLSKRAPQTAAGLSAFLGRSLSAEESALRIAFAGSGGGYRAMLSTLGFMAGAEKNGLLAATTYAAGLSGSTWAVGASADSRLSVSEYLAWVRPQLETKLAKPVHTSWFSIAKRLLKQHSAGDYLSIVDVYGELLADKLLTDTSDAQAQTMTSITQQPGFQSASRPFPLFVSLNVDKDEPAAQYHRWFEFSPIESGCVDFQAWVPTPSLGSHFSRGQLTKALPEQPLGGLLGMFGSAFEVTLQYMYEHFAKLQKWLKWMHDPHFFDDRITPKRFANWMLGLPAASGAQPPPQTDTLAFVDAGIDFNLPMPPLLRRERAVDVIFVFDSGAGEARGAPSLRESANWAAHNGYSMPPIDYTGINATSFSFFPATAADEPSIIYMPLWGGAARGESVVNDYSTFKLQYSLNESTTLSTYSYNSMLDNTDAIRAALEHVLAFKHQ